MRRHVRAVWSASLLAPLLCCRAQTMDAAPERNLAPNPGFEEAGESGWALEWSPRPGVYALDASSPRNGKRCLSFRNTDASKYVLCNAPIELEIGKQYEFEVWVRTEGVEGPDSGATICLQWWDKDREFIGGAYPGGVKGTQREWKRVVGRTARIPENAAGFDVTCYVRKGMTGAAWWDDVAIRLYHPPLVGAMTTNRYRGQVDGGTVAVRAGLDLASHDLTPDDVVAELRVEADDGRLVATVSPGALSESETAFEIDAMPLEPGRYSLRCSVRSRDGRSSGTASCPLRRTEKAKPRKATIDEHQRLILDGEPFFPLGTYWGSITEPHLEIYAKSPFNCIMPYGTKEREQLDLAQAHGVKVIFSVKDYYYGTKWCPPQVGSLAEERPTIEAVVRAVGDHPAIMAWYINDELPLSMIDRLSARRDLLEELDPSRPTWVVLYQVGDVRSYLPSFDVIGTDPYPIPTRPASTALDYTRRTVDATFKYRAVWMVPQIFNWASYKKTPEEKEKHRAPTFEEMRSMAWQCIAGGANGLVFYSWFDLWRMDKETASGGEATMREPFEERWRDVCRMAEPIKRLMPVLLSAEQCPQPVQVEASGPVAWRLYAKDGDTVVVAVNSADESATAALTFAGTIGGAESLLGQSPPVLDERTVRLTFAPLEPKVVRLRSGR